MLTLSPLVSATIGTGGSGVIVSYPNNPQLYCASVHDAPDTHECLLKNVHGRVNLLKARSSGGAEIIIILDKEIQPGHRQRLGVLECSTSLCELPIAFVDSERLFFHVYITGGAGAAGIATAEYRA